MEFQNSEKSGSGSRAGESMVEQTYHRLLKMINDFELLPRQRVNEVEVAKKLGVSRTPLREALNRLAIEGFLTVERSKGFFCRSLNVEESFQLYQFRAIIETAGTRLAVRNAKDDDLRALQDFLLGTGGPDIEPIDQMLGYDEYFHESIMRMSGNAELLRTMQNLNRRIRPLRWIDLKRRGRSTTQEEHQQILRMIIGRSEERAAQLIELHIARRRDEIDASIRQLYGDLYATRSMGPNHEEGSGSPL